VISEENLMFSFFVENALEYYRNVFLLIILKEIFFASKLHALICVKYIWSIVTYINILSQNDSYIPKCFSSFPSPFATKISYPFHISFKPKFTSVFSRRILSKVFDLPFHISAVSKSPMLCFVCHVTFELYIRVSNYKLYHNTYLETTS